MKKILSAQRNGPADYLEHHVEAVAKGKGGGKGKTQVYLNPDKNDMTIRLEMAWKKLFSILKDELPSTKVQCRRAEGAVSTSWKPLLQISAPNRQKTELVWHPTRAQSIGLDQKRVATAFSEEFCTTDATSWKPCL